MRCGHDWVLIATQPLDSDTDEVVRIFGCPDCQTQLTTLPNGTNLFTPGFEDLVADLKALRCELQEEVTS